MQMTDGSRNFLPSAELTVLQQILSKERDRVQEQLEAMVKENFELQEFASKKGFCERVKHLSEFERTVGFFSAQLLMHQKHYLFMYLNALIHGLLRARKLF